MKQKIEKVITILDNINDTLNDDVNNHYKIERKNKFRLSTGPSKSKPMCKRQLYLEIRNYLPTIKYSCQQINTFEIGSQLENLITKRLTDYGFVLSHILEEQQEFNFFPGLRGFADGIVESVENTFLSHFKEFKKNNTRMLLEMKTSKDKNFQILKEKKLKNAKIQHYAQMQSYLYAMSKMEEYKDIEYGLYVCLNKDDSSMYFEIIERDLEFGKENIEELKNIIYSSTIPRKTRVFCNWCDYKRICEDADDHFKRWDEVFRIYKICNKCKFCNRNKDTGEIICEKNNQKYFNIESEEMTDCPEFDVPDLEELEIKNNKQIENKQVENKQVENKPNVDLAELFKNLDAVEI